MPANKMKKKIQFSMPLRWFRSRLRFLTGIEIIGMRPYQISLLKRILTGGIWWFLGKKNSERTQNSQQKQIAQHKE